jgi:hypothetical protein
MLALRRSRSIQYSKEINMILANAIVDIIHKPAPASNELSRFRVEVWGKEPHDYVRVYEIAAKDDNMAAREGLDRFVEGIGQLLEKQGD